jgi:GAF domain-containing protein
VPDAALIAYMENHPEPIAANSPHLPPTVFASPSFADVGLLVPLVSESRLVGLLSLGAPRESKAYSADELLFVSTLADAAGAAARIVQLRQRSIAASTSRTASDLAVAEDQRIDSVVDMPACAARFPF